MRLERLVRMRPAELVERARQEAGKQLDRVVSASRRTPAPARVLDRLAGGLTTAALRHDARPGSFDRAAERLRDRLVESLPARFFPGAGADETAKLVWQHAPGLAEATIRTAEAAGRGRFDLLGYRGLDFGTPIDWRFDPVSGQRSPLVHWSRLDPLDPTRVGDSKVVWELGRQQWAIHLAQAYRLSGDPRHARTAIAAIFSWIDANPRGLGIHWASSLEIAFRLLSWLWTLALCRDAEALTPGAAIRIVDAIDRQARHVARHLSHYFSPNTHLTGEALGLFAVGVALPELAGAAAWRETGRRILDAEATRQIRPDGTHFEQAACYQRYTAEIYLHYRVLADRHGLDMPPAMLERVERLIDALLALRLPDGTLPPIGDADGGWLFPQPGRGPRDPRGVLGLAAAVLGRPDCLWAAEGLTPETLWILGPEAVRAVEAIAPAPPASPASCVLPDGGVVVMRSGWAEDAHQLILDAGPFGDPASGAHGHADLLAIQVAAFGAPAVVDGGTGNYTAAPVWRAYFRGSRAHATVLVDGQDQALPRGPFGWTHRPGARLTRWTVGDEVELAEAEHDAYDRLTDPVRHRRRVLFVHRQWWVVIDDLLGRAVHTIELRFPLAPCRAMLSPDGWVRVPGAGSGGLLIRAVAAVPLATTLVEGALDPIDGWISTDYGTRQAAPVLLYRASATLPLRMVTILWPVKAIDAAPPAVDVRPDPTGIPRAVVAADGTVLDLEGGV